MRKAIEMDREKIHELMFRLWWWARVYALYAAILFAILWVVANCCAGCANESPSAPKREADAVPAMLLSERLSGMMEEMRREGCWPMEFSVSFSPPTNYSVSVSGKYYDALDRNRTNFVNRCERKGD